MIFNNNILNLICILDVLEVMYLKNSIKVCLIKITRKFNTRVVEHM